MRLPVLKRTRILFLRTASVAGIWAGLRDLAENVGLSIPLQSLFVRYVTRMQRQR